MSTASLWTPHVTVATVIERGGRFLFVEEEINGELVLNQPAGHWEANETLMEAAVRETFEETGWHVEVQALLGIYEYQPPGLDFTFLRFAFSARALSHDPEHKLDVGIHRWLWLDQHELRDQSYRHRSPMVQACTEDFWAAKRTPLTILHHLTPRKVPAPAAVEISPRDAIFSGDISLIPQR